MTPLYVLLDQKHNPSFLDKMVYLLFASLATFPQTAATVVALRLLIFEPCAPVYLGSLFLECQACGRLAAHQTWSAARFLFPILDFLNIHTRVIGGWFYMFFFYMVADYCLLRYTQILAEMDMRPSQFMLYRNLEVLERMLNNYGRGQLVPATLTIGPVVEIVSLFGLIKMHAEIPFPGILVLPMGFSGALCGVSLLEVASGKLRTMSEDMLWSWQHGRSKYYRRKIQSMQPLTVRFGSNFIDKGTILATQNFCVNQTVSLLMM